MTPSRPFAAAAALATRGPGCFDAQVDAGWTIGGRPNGGYLLAMTARAAAATSHHPHPVAASAHFLRSPEPGPAVIETELARAGRAVDHVRVRLVQTESPCVEAIVTTATLDASSAVVWDGGVPPRPACTFEECVPAPRTMADGSRVAIADQVDLRLEPASAGFMRGEPSGRGELCGWLALGDDEPFDPASLLFAVDSFPPASFDVAFSGWVPTLELTAYVRASRPRARSRSSSRRA